MARRQGGFSDFLDLASKLPWQVGCGLAVVSFLVLHFTTIAFAGSPSAPSLGEFGNIVVHQIVHTGAYLLQFVVPLGFLIGGAVSFFKGSPRRSLFAKASAAPRAAVSGLDWRDFESLMGEVFRRDGYQVTERGGSSPDGGVDLVLTKSKQRYLVQCKHWRTQQVGVTVVRELNGVIAAQSAAGGFVVTGGEFTREAREFASRTKIVLIGGNELEKLIGEVSAPAAPAVEPQAISRPTPACPRCGTAMVEREAKRGQFVGKPFWGCRQFPRCEGILPISYL
jgi:restriction system protein